jgi:thiamine biosynthesis lipoprotein
MATSTPLTGNDMIVWFPVVVDHAAFGSRCGVWADCLLDPAPIVALWEELEQSWSRFRPYSDLNRVIARTGEWVDVPEHFAAAVAAAVQFRTLSDGLFDPTVDVAACGYTTHVHDDLSFVPVPHPAGRPVDVDLDCSAVRLHHPVLDLGGVGKGLAADLTVAAQQMFHPDARIVVDLGGDIATSAPVSVVAKYDSGDGSRVPWSAWMMSAGGLATSSSLRRRWRTAGGDAHHLLDPRTGEPSAGFVTVTAHAASAAAADVAAKIVAVSGRLDAAECVGAVAAAVDVDGTVHAGSAGPWMTVHQSSPGCLSGRAEQGLAS